MRLLSIVHAYSLSQQGTRWIDVDPRTITSVRAVRLHPFTTHRVGVEITVAPHGYSETLALPIPWDVWAVIVNLAPYGHTNGT